MCCSNELKCPACGAVLEFAPKTLVEVRDNVPVDAADDASK